LNPKSKLIDLIMLSILVWVVVACFIVLVVGTRRKRRRIEGKVLYGSQSGGCEKLARRVGDKLREKGINVKVVDLKDYEVEDLLKEKLILVVISTYEGGDPPDSAKWFCR